MTDDDAISSMNQCMSELRDNNRDCQVQITLIEWLIFLIKLFHRDNKNGKKIA